MIVTFLTKPKIWDIIFVISRRAENVGKTAIQFYELNELAHALYVAYPQYDTKSHASLLHKFSDTAAIQLKFTVSKTFLLKSIS